MLSRIGYVCGASKDQHFTNCLKQRFLTTARFHLSSPSNRPFVHLVMLGSSSRRLSSHSNVNLYHLRKHRLMFNAAMTVRNYAKDGEVPTVENHPDAVKENSDTIILKREKDRLKMKGVMKDRPIKIPEAIAGLKQTK